MSLPMTKSTLPDERRGKKVFDYKAASILSATEIFNQLGSSSEGLNSKDAAKQLALGPNEITTKQTTWQEVLLRQFKSSFIYLLFAAFVISLFMGEKSDAILILLFLIYCVPL